MRPEVDNSERPILSRQLAFREVTSTSCLRCKAVHQSPSSGECFSVILEQKSTRTLVKLVDVRQPTGDQGGQPTGSSINARNRAASGTMKPCGRLTDAKPANT